MTNSMNRQIILHKNEIVFFCALFAAGKSEQAVVHYLCIHSFVQCTSAYAQGHFTLRWNGTPNHNAIAFQMPTSVCSSFLAQVTPIMSAAIRVIEIETLFTRKDNPAHHITLLSMTNGPAETGLGMARLVVQRLYLCLVCVSFLANDLPVDRHLTRVHAGRNSYPPDTNFLHTIALWVALF